MPPGTSLVCLDGSILEGGGQILRYASALAAITGIEGIKIQNIRGNRPKPGLRPQHLAGLELVARISNSRLEGGKVGSKEVTLTRLAEPASNSSTAVYTADPGTAGSCCLLAQSALPVLLWARGSTPESASQLELRGGTDVDFAPPVGYMQHILLSALRRLFHLDVQLKLQRRGFFPKGAGIVHMEIPGVNRLPGFTLVDRGEVLSVTITAFSSGGLPPSVTKVMASAAQAVLKQGLGSRVPVSVETEQLSMKSKPQAFGDGSGILLVAETQSGCALGAARPGTRGQSPKETGAEAAQELLEDLQSGGCVDRWLQDQLIIFMALADGPSSMTCGEPTLHTKTAIAVAEKLTEAKFEVEDPTEGSKFYTITCKGAAFKADR